MKLVTKKISLEELKEMSKKTYNNLVKAVVDSEKDVMVVDGVMHVDEEVLLLEGGSQQENLWGINIYPYKPIDQWIEFDALINMRFSNSTRGVDDSATQEKIKKIVYTLVEQ